MFSADLFTQARCPIFDMFKKCNGCFQCPPRKARIVLDPYPYLSQGPPPVFGTGPRLFSINELLGRLPRFEDMEWDTAAMICGGGGEGRYFVNLNAGVLGIHPNAGVLGIHPTVPIPSLAAFYFSNVDDSWQIYSGRHYQEIQFLSDGKFKVEVLNELYAATSCAGFDQKGIVEIKPQGDFDSLENNYAFSLKRSTMGVMC